MEKPHTGLDNCLNMLLSCFRKMMSSSISKSVHNAIVIKPGRRSAVAGPGLLLRRHPARGERERRRVVAGAQGAAQRRGGRRPGSGPLQAALGAEDWQEEQGRMKKSGVHWSCVRSDRPNPQVRQFSGYCAADSRTNEV